MNAKGLFGTREPDGSVNLSDIVVPDSDPDGRKHRHGFFISEESARKFIERSCARGEKTTELSLPKEIVFDASYLQTLPFVFTLATRKVVAKIALASIAHKYGLSYALSSQFDGLRQVRTARTEREIPLRVFCNRNFMAAHARDAYQHSVMCYLSAGMKKGWALVTLFRGLSYVVEVTPNYQEQSSRMFSIFYDAALKKPLNPSFWPTKWWSSETCFQRIRSSRTKTRSTNSGFLLLRPIVPMLVSRSNKCDLRTRLRPALQQNVQSPGIRKRKQLARFQFQFGYQRPLQKPRHKSCRS